MNHKNFLVRVWAQSDVNKKASLRDAFLFDYDVWALSHAQGKARSLFERGTKARRINTS